MKKLLSLLLALALCLSVAACDSSDKGSGKGGQAVVPVPDLTAAVQKLDSATSLQLTFRFEQSDNGYTSSTYQTYQMLKKDSGIQIRVNVQEDVPTGMGGSSNMETHSFYYEDNIGYYVDLYTIPKATTKVVNSENFTLYDALESHSDLLITNKTGFVEAFAAMNPTAIVKDGLTICSKDITIREYLTLMNALSGEVYVSEEDLAGITYDSLIATVSVDSQGYLYDIALKTEMQGMTATITIALDQINQLQTLEIPDIAKNFAYTINTRLEIRDGLMRAHYSYDNWSANYFVEDEGWVDVTCTGLGFVGFGDYYYDDYAVEFYEIPAEIDGIPVTYVSDILNNHFSSVTVDRLVIPAGAIVNLCGVWGETSTQYYCENTTLFFHDTKDAVISNVHTADEASIPSNSPIAKAIYYGSEWGYINGIPTPIG